MCSKPKIDIDKFLIDVLPSGEIIVETGEYEGTMHLTADGFVDYMNNLNGGTIDRKVRDRELNHHHHHLEHEHNHS